MSFLRQMKQVLFLANTGTVLLIVGVIMQGLYRQGHPVGIAAQGPMHASTLAREIRISDLTQRNLLRPLYVAPPAPKIIKPVVVLPPPPPKIPLSQKASRLHLVGILNGDPVQAVIEDSQTHSTLYVKAGQTIDDILVEKILNDRVVLFSVDEHMDLML
jgi:hypothetical protein